MEDLDNIDRILYQDDQALLDPPLPRQTWRKHEREDFFDTLRDAEFRLQYRFTKDSVLKIADLLTPHLRPADRSHCLTPLQMTMLTLSNLAGDGFQRTTALHVRCSQGTVCNVMGQTLDAILQLKDQYVRFRSHAETEESANFIKDRFHLENFPYAIDGCHVVFKTRP